MYALDMRSPPHAPAAHPQRRSRTKLATRGWRDDLAIYDGGAHAHLAEWGGLGAEGRDELLAFVGRELDTLRVTLAKWQDDLAGVQDKLSQYGLGSTIAGWIGMDDPYKYELEGQAEALAGIIERTTADIALLEGMEADLIADTSFDAVAGAPVSTDGYVGWF